MSRRAAFAAVVLTLVSAACARQTESRHVSQSAPWQRNTITAEDIERLGAEYLSALQVLQRFPHLVSVVEDNNGQPRRISKRGRHSLLLDSSPKVVLDGVRLADIRMLSSIPARDVALITVWNPAEAPSRYGGDNAGGVIVIDTKHGGGVAYHRQP